ncbi:MAG: PT domain-containing protein, partial [Chthoniobacterales bacterium]|nr:PT domain-containing protein [Chthoniobacterales bacterium]
MIKVHKHFCCYLIVGTTSLFATPWKTTERLSREKQQHQYQREQSDEIAETSLIGKLNADEISSSLQERGIKLPAEKKSDKISWLEEERSFWEERQEWLIEMERDFHAEPYLSNREAIFKKVAALVEDAQEAEMDLREASSPQSKVEATDSLTTTIEAIQETKRLGTLFLSSYNNFSNGLRTTDFAGSTGFSTSEFADIVANSGIDPIASHQAEDSLNQTLKKSNGLAPKYRISGTDPFFVRRAGKAFVSFLAASSMIPREAFSSVSSMGSLGTLRGIGSLGAASFFLSRLPGAKAREEYFSSPSLASFPNLTSSDFQYLNQTSSNLIPYSFSPSPLPVSLSRERNIEQEHQRELIQRRLGNNLLSTSTSSSAITQADKSQIRQKQKLPIIPPYQNGTHQLDTLAKPEERRRLQDALSSEFQVSTLTTGNNYLPMVAALSGGGYVVTLYGGSPAYQIYGRLYDSSGNAIGSSEFQISTLTTGNNVAPSVAAFSGGGFVVTWRNDVSSGIDQIYGRRYDSSGNAIGSSEFQISTLTTGNNNNPTVAALSGGGFVVTWNNDAFPLQIYGRRYDSSGNAIGSSEFQISTLTTGNNVAPSVAAFSGGGFVVTWRNDVSSGIDQIYGRRYDSSGNAIGSSEFQISTLTTGNNNNPTVAALSGGGFVVTWNNDAFPLQIYGRRYDSSGNAIGSSEFQISTLSTGSHQNPSVAAFSGGGYVVTWWNNASPNKVYARRYDSSGNAIGSSEFQINTNTGNNQFPSVTELSGGSSYIVTWQQEGSPWTVYGRVFTSISPTSQPSTQPSTQPSSQPTSQPSAQPTDQPTLQPTLQPSTQPTSSPTSQPSKDPTTQPTSSPTTQPSAQPTRAPSGQPSLRPSSQPTGQPSSQPSSQPTRQPTGQPTSQPTLQPSTQPTSSPTSQPSKDPTTQPTTSPTSQPSSQPITVPSGQPSSKPSVQPTTQP